MMSIITKNKEKRLRKAYEEVLSFLGIIEKEYYEKIPKDFIKFLEENKDNNYSSCKPQFSYYHFMIIKK